MKYYKVKPQHDNKRRSDGSILVENELYTEKELQRYKIPVALVDMVQIPKTQIYFFFGARFAR